MKHYLLVGLGGALGSMLRYAIGSSMAERFGVRFPYGTLLINILACFFIGLSLEYLNQHLGLNPAWRFLVPIGFIGGFSTFSGFEWEAWASFTNGALWTGISYIVISIVVGLLAVVLGTMTAKTLP